MTAKPWPSRLPIFDSSASHNRFSLGTSGQQPLICFGVNPSVATDLQSDDTLRIVAGFTARSAPRFDSWIMFNVYGQRATKPRDLHSALDSALHQQNLEVIAGLIRGRPMFIYAAWGSNIELRPYLGDALRDIATLPELTNVQWMHRGLTDRGHPHHPLGTPKHAVLQKLDIQGYLSRF